MCIRDSQKAERHFGIYALYVMFYPQLVAGPIERPQNLLHQFKEYHEFNSQNLLEGLRLMLWGFFKKLVIADRLAQYVSIVYGSPSDYHFLNIIIATLFFTIQIYCDFSGYSDIAIGAARTMGFDLMTNFNRPYFSKNIQEFWKKWHISLSTWFRDYLYISLGGNRVSTGRVYFNVAVVFLVSGLWHGANWTFLIWGGLHSVFILSYMAINQYTPFKLPDRFIFNLLSAVLTFCLVSIAWIFFRAKDLHTAVLIVKHIFTFYHRVPFTWVLSNESNQTQFGVISTAIAVFMSLIMFSTESLVSVNLSTFNKRPAVDIGFCIFILTLTILLGVFQHNSFIYFQF